MANFAPLAFFYCPERNYRIMATAKTATKQPEVEVAQAPEVEVAQAPDNSNARIEHVVYVLTNEPNIAGGIPSDRADVRLTARIQAGQEIMHMNSTPYIDTNTREEIGTRVFVVFRIPG
jgi:hypothetical protein